MSKKSLPTSCRPGRVRDEWSNECKVCRSYNKKFLQWLAHLNGLDPNGSPRDLCRRLEILGRTKRLKFPEHKDINELEKQAIALHALQEEHAELSFKQQILNDQLNSLLNE